MPQPPQYDNSGDPLRSRQPNPLIVQELAGNPARLTAYLQRLQSGNVSPDLAQFVMGRPQPQPNLLQRLLFQQSLPNTAVTSIRG